MRGAQRCFLQGHFSPSSITSPQIHGPQEVTGNLIGFKTATCPESARCLSRQGRESKMFTDSGDMVTVEQGRQAGLPGMSWPHRGETAGIPDGIPSFGTSISPATLQNWQRRLRAAQCPHDEPAPVTKPWHGGFPALQRSLALMPERDLWCFLPRCPSLLSMGKDQPLLVSSC